MMMDNEIDGDMEELPGQPRVDVPESDLILLQRAAHAIGAVRFEVVVGEGYVNLHFADGSVIHSWNPLMFNGDALDLAVRLRLEIYIHEHDTSAMTSDRKLANEPHGGDAGAATRRAITRVAGEIES
ncbi:hypothetical protein ACFOY5_10620 [Massilia aurea]|jgi:hypothetical protein|uniref:hypothetical protein n=2 Tax=Massilia aurea TaxID=373040 RepID=UPI002161497E|nr:hypothetical protein [Massilia aurea]MCS0709488.1 hypothetical protein [Massilia aurea]